MTAWGERYSGIGGGGAKPAIFVKSPWVSDSGGKDFTSSKRVTLSG